MIARNDREVLLLPVAMRISPVNYPRCLIPTSHVLAASIHDGVSAIVTVNLGAAASFTTGRMVLQCPIGSDVSILNLEHQQEDW
jgi:hypothetical protein